MTVVQRANDILLLVPVELTVHGYDPDVLHRGLVVNGEVGGVISLKSVALSLDAVAVVYTVLPSRCAGIDLSVQHQFGQYEIHHWQSHPAIRVATICTLSVGNKGTALKQFLFHEIKHLGAFRLLHVVHRGMGRGEDRYTPEEVEQIPIADGAECPHLGGVDSPCLLIDHLLMGLNLFDGTVAEGDDLIEVEP